MCELEKPLAKFLHAFRCGRLSKKCVSSNCEASHANRPRPDLRRIWLPLLTTKFTKIKKTQCFCLASDAEMLKTQCFSSLCGLLFGLPLVWQEI